MDADIIFNFRFVISFYYQNVRTIKMSDFAIEKAVFLPFLCPLGAKNAGI
jgi:hypothetical protein